MSDHRFARSVADFCRTTGEWRRRKAEEDDRDARNRRAAADGAPRGGMRGRPDSYHRGSRTTRLRMRLK